MQIEQAKAERRGREDLRDALARILYQQDHRHRPHSLKNPGSNEATWGRIDWAWHDAYERAEEMLDEAGQEW